MNLIETPEEKAGDHLSVGFFSSLRNLEFVYSKWIFFLSACFLSYQVADSVSKLLHIIWFPSLIIAFSLCLFAFWQITQAFSLFILKLLFLNIVRKRHMSCCYLTELSVIVKCIDLFILCHLLSFTLFEFPLMMFATLLALSPVFPPSALVSPPYASSWRSSVPLTFIREMCQSRLLPLPGTLTLDRPHSTHCLFLFPPSAPHLSLLSPAV